MDPITLGKLFAIIDGIEEHRVNDHRSISSSVFARIIAKRTNAKNLKRRERDVRRILESSSWLEFEDEIIHLTVNYFGFVSAWNKGDLLKLNTRLADYPPYARFLDCLREQKDLPIFRSEIGNRLKKKYDLTFVAYDTFRRWATAAGHAYLSPFGNSIYVYWGGEWDENSPSLDEFKKYCRSAYLEVQKASGYANIGRVADIVCRKMYISFQAFEDKMNLLLQRRPGLMKLARATIREPFSEYEITTIRPRSEVLKERLAADLLRGEFSVFEPKWLEHRYLEDGIRVDGKLVKLIRWEGTS